MSGVIIRPMESHRMTPERWNLVVRPRIAALLLAVLYVVLSVAYILTSSHVAAVSAHTVEHLERLERIKGVIFVLGTGALFYAVAALLLLRVQRQQEQLAAQHEALVASEHRALAGLFAASIAHDINNVAMVARGNAELLLKPLAGTETRKEVGDALFEAFVRLSALSQRLMTLGQAAAAGPKPERDLAASIDRAIALARRHERVRRCRVTARTGGALLMPIDETLVDRMILNLVLNAADATGGTGRIEVRLRRADDGAVIEVHDDGPGVPADSRETIFEAFYSSKPNGLGLGLMSVKACAADHDGTVEVLDSDLGGACFRVTLPPRRAVV
jgi:signal transduction histidine kinase